ncbi:MAG: hypothetical protein WCJ97_07500 [Phycisphaerae bacterium]
MKVKNVHPLERHAEKLVFGLAVAGAAYLGLTSMISQPVVVEFKNQVLTPAEVEEKVGAALRDLQNTAKETEKKLDALKAASSTSRTDFVKKYRASKESPLPRELLASVADFGPTKYSVNPGIEKPVGIAVTFTVPKLPALVNPRLLSGPKDGRVVVSAPGPVGPTGTPTTVKQGITYVQVAADLPVLTLREQMLGVGIVAPNEALPVELTGNPHILKLEVQRQERLSDGSWSTWAAVTPRLNTSANLPPLTNITDSATAGEYLLAANKLIGPMLRPAFYTLDNDTKVWALPPAPVKDSATAKQLENLRAFSVKVNTEWQGEVPKKYFDQLRILGVTPLLNDRIYIPQDPMGPSDGDTGPAAAPIDSTPRSTKTTTPGGLPVGSELTNAQLLAQSSVPVWIFDDTIKPDGEYRYQLRYMVFNPTYKLPEYWKLTEDGARTRPVLTAPWAITEASYRVPPDAYVFIDGFQPDRERVSVSLFKWMEGQWYMVPETVNVGATLNLTRNYPNGNKVDYLTNYRVVDILHPNPSRPQDVVVVFETADGKLLTRSSRADAADPRREELVKRENPLRPSPSSGRVGGS